MKQLNFLSRLTAHGSRLTAHGSRLTAHGSRLTAIISILMISTILRLNAQCFEADGITVRQSYYNIMIAVDQGWINDFFGGDVTMARMSAEQQVNDAIGMVGLNTPTSPFAFFYKLTFRVIFFPSNNEGLDMTPGESLYSYTYRLSTHYRSKYPCANFDCLIYFTSVSGTDLSYGLNGVVVTPGQDKPSMAHEIGHTLGLQHLEVDCCKTLNTIMCAPPKSTAKMTPHNADCSWGVPKVNSLVFTSTKCARFADMAPVLPPDFECPVSVSPKLSIMQENPNPVVNCRDGGDIDEITLSFFNGTLQKDVRFRVFIGSSWEQYVEFVQDPTLDFNCIKSSPSKSEFLITDPVNPTCDNEKTFSVCPSCSTIVELKIKYLGGLLGSTGSIPVTVEVYYGLNSDPSLSSTLRIIPFNTINSGNLSTIPNWSNVKPVMISGKLIMDADLTFHPGGVNKLLFGPGASMEVATGISVTMDHVVAEGCSTMWEGITVRNSASLAVKNMCEIKDAQFAVNVRKGATANIQSCKFVDNNFAIRTAPEGSGVYNITALGNKFSTSDGGLKPSYSGQSPAPGITGFAGIYVKDHAGGLSIDKDAVFGLANSFTNLHYGILAENTNVTVRDAMFLDITKETKPTGYPGPLFTGSAIYLNGGAANVKGSFTGIAPDPVVMDNCHTGVNVLGGSIDVGGCDMGNMTNGIVAGGGTNKAYKIYWNNIAASERGISVYYQSGLPGQASIDNNIIQMLGNPNAIGIATGGQEMFPQQEGFVVNNHVTIDEGATGIQIGVANRIKVTQNTVNLAGSGTLFGIKMEGGDRNTLNCNSISSTSGNNDGIYAIHAGRASVLCNVTNGPARGLHFEGMLSGKSKADIAGNRMENNSSLGLLLGTDAVLGEQLHRGNKFVSTEAAAGIGVQLHSKFTVDAAENPDFLPNAWQPFPWFLNSALPAPSFDCGANTTCPPPPGPTPEYPLDIMIVRGELGGTTYQAANQWLSQRRFYELVAEEGNPYPGNSDVSTFLSQAQSNGLSGYANVQIGIRQLGAMSEGARATAAANLLAMNGNLLGSATYQVNEKTVNGVFLQTVALDNPILSPAQTASLASIATQCPLSGGEAVLRARALLNLNLETPVVYNDAICNAQRPSGERNEASIAKGVMLKIYPNPASDMLNIEYSKLENAGDIQFALYDTYGRVVREVPLTNKEGKVQVDVQNLPEGIYWYVLPGILIGKVILQH